MHIARLDQATVGLRSDDYPGNSLVEYEMY